MSKNYLIPTLTALGTIGGGLIWLWGYGMNHTTIGFDGPAGVTMLSCLALGSLIFGVPTALYVVRKKYVSYQSAVGLFMVTAFGVCGLAGYVIGNYAINKYSDAPKDLQGCYTTGDGRATLCDF